VDTIAAIVSRPSMSGRYSNTEEATGVYQSTWSKISSTLPLDELPQPRLGHFHPDAVLKGKRDYGCHTMMTTRTIATTKPTIVSRAIPANLMVAVNIMLVSTNLGSHHRTLSHKYYQHTNGEMLEKSYRILIVTMREVAKTSRLSEQIKPNFEDIQVIEREPKQNKEIAEKTRKEDK